MKKLLFLCTGNYYRSRFAEYLFNAQAQKHGLDWQADSRGLAIERGVNNIGPISDYAVSALAEIGLVIPDSDRFPRQAIEADFTAAHKIIALDESEHRPLMMERFPRWTEAIEYWLVHDVDRSHPTVALKQIEEHIGQVISLINQ